jgi:hypothetical protein
MLWMSVLGIKVISAMSAAVTLLPLLGACEVGGALLAALAPR